MNNKSGTQESNKTRLYEALGQIVVSFKALELAVEGIIYCGMQVPTAQARILLSNMPFKTKVANMESLVSEIHADDDLGSLAATLSEFVERCYFCEQQRNSWVRTYWVPELEAEQGYIKRLQPNTAVNSQGSLILNSVSLLELESFVLCLNATVTYLYAFHQRLFANFGRMRDPQSLSEYIQLPLLAGNDN